MRYDYGYNMTMIAHNEEKLPLKLTDEILMQ